MIFIIISLGILIYAHYDLKKSFMLFLAYKLILVTNITVVSEPGLPVLTVELFLTIIYTILFFYKGKRYQNAHGKFPFSFPFILCIITISASSIFSVSGFSAELPNLVKNILEDIVLIWMTWEIVEEEKDFKYLYKVVTIIIFVSCVYGIFEYIIQDNPLVAYETTLIKDKSKLFDGRYRIDARGYRILSIFEHPIGAGIHWGIYSVFTFWLWINRRKSFIVPKFAMLTAFLCLPCIAMTKMRSPILFFVISSLSLINLKNKRTYLLLYIGIALSILVFPSLIKSNSVIMSFFSRSAAEKAGGSSLNMRLYQMQTALELMSMSPITGLGAKFQSVLSANMTRGLLGMESVWIFVTVSYGVMGIISYVVYAFVSVFIVPRRYRSQAAFFFALAYWMTYTTTSIPGFDLVFYFIPLFYFIKTSDKYINEAKNENVYGFYLKGDKLIYGEIKSLKGGSNS